MRAWHRIGRVPRRLLAVGGACSLVVLIAMAFSAETGLRAWLAAAVLWTGLPIGALAILMMMRLVPGLWASELMVPMEAATLLVPLAALVFLPVLIGMGSLYGWAGAEQATAFRRVYLSQPFFALRTLLWFAILGVLTVLLIARRRWSTPVSSIGLIVYALAGTVIATDWLMSLDPTFHSSGFGLYVLSIQMTVALVLGIVVALASGATVRRPQMLGGLLLTALLIWAYLSFMQFVIIWSGDLPEGVSWYLRRSAGGWGIVLWALAVLHAIPMMMLLLPPVLRHRTALLVLSGMILAGKAVEVAWLVLPADGFDAGWSGGLLFIVAVVGIGAVFAAAGMQALAARIAARAPEPARREAAP